MPWYDDHWRDGYDAWKLASPDDERQNECYHEEYEADVNGFATCDQCGERWKLTPSEIYLERELHRVYDRLMRREERRKQIERWTRWTRKLAFWRRRHKPEVINDELPF